MAGPVPFTVECDYCGVELLDVAWGTPEIRCPNCRKVSRLDWSVLGEPPAQESPSQHSTVKQPLRAAECDLVGINGWLIFPALWLTLGTVWHAFQLILECLAIFFNFRERFVAMLVLVVLLDAALFVLRICVAFLFFGRHRSLPKLMIVFLVASCWCDFWLAAFIGGAPDLTRFLVVGIFCATWIPYFLVSRRVKATFVVGSPKENDPMIYKKRTWRQATADLEADGYAMNEGDGLAARLKRGWESFLLIPKQKKIVWTGVACLVLLGLIVPWKGDANEDAGYSLIFIAPRVYEVDSHGRETGRNRSYRGIRLDLPRIILPMFVVVCATVAGAWLTREKPPKST